MNLLRGEFGRRGNAGAQFVPRLAVGQIAQGNGFAGAGQIFVHQEGVQLPKCRDDLFLQCGFRFLPQARLLCLRDTHGKFPEAVEQGVLLRIGLHLVFHLLRHVAQGDARWRDAGGQPLLQQHEGLANQRGHSIEARNQVFVILDGRVRCDGEHARDVLLEAVELGDLKIFTREARARHGQLIVFAEQVVAELIGVIELRAVDGADDLERRLQLSLPSRDGLH